MKEFIQDVFDPTGDGNCGYHCVAKALGYGEDGWFWVRKEMLDKAKEHKRVSSRLQGGEGGFKLMIKALEVESKDTEIEETQWLSKMAHGQLIANTYQRPVIFLSKKECITFLPLRTVAPGDADPIYLLHVNNNHWVLAHVQEKDGVRPIPPPFFAQQGISKVAKTWMIYLEKGLALYSSN
jgi:histone-lysine N-methyltransferase SETD2